MKELPFVIYVIKGVICCDKILKVNCNDRNVFLLFKILKELFVWFFLLMDNQIHLEIKELNTLECEVCNGMFVIYDIKGVICLIYLFDWY